MRRSNQLGRLGLALLLGLAPVLGRAGEESAPLYRLTVTGCTKAINYRYLDGQSRVHLQGTVLQPAAGGQAIVRGRSGGMLIRMKLHGLEPASRLGPGYLTYVLWAISPTGSPSNLGEVEVRHGRARVEATTHLHTFGLVLTAEPHFAVTRVSNAVVLENVVPSGHGRVQAVEASYELLPRGDAPLALVAGAADLDAKASPYVSQARLALRIAEAEGAGELAPLEYRRAKGLLEQMEAEKHLRSRPAILLARQAIQEAEDARRVAANKLAEQRFRQEREGAEEARRQLEAARAQAEAYRLQAAEAGRKVQQKTRQAREASEEAQAEKRALRAKLVDQLNRLLRTQDTGQGVIVTLSDVLFPTGRHALSSAAREKLAKVAGILLAYPGLTVRVEGHTDSTGSGAFNRKLAEKRASSVRNYLITQGFPTGSAVSVGLGSSQPAAPNDTPDGRQQNRRVELILGGEPIGF